MILYAVCEYIQYEKDEAIAIFDSFEKAENYALEISKDNKSVDWFYIGYFELNNPNYRYEPENEYITYENGKKIID